MRYSNSQALISAGNASKRALILFTSDPGKEAFRKNVGKNCSQNREIYRAFLRHTLGIATAAQEQGDFDIIIASEGKDLPGIEEVCGASPETKPLILLEQRGNCFDSRFKHTLNAVFEMGYQEVVIIGNDCPDITPQILQTAFDNLSRGETVVGPAKDGGFYLLGITEYNPALFVRISWGSASVFQQVCRNISALQQSRYLLPCLGDIDSYRDLIAWLCSPCTNWANRLFRMLVSLMIIRFTPAFHQPPFLAGFHRNKRIWQLPPPLPV